MFMISLKHFTLPSLSALHTHIFRQAHSCPQGHRYQLSSERIFLKASKCEEEDRQSRLWKDLEITVAPVV